MPHSGSLPDTGNVICAPGNRVPWSGLVSAYEASEENLLGGKNMPTSASVYCQSTSTALGRVGEALHSLGETTVFDPCCFFKLTASALALNREVAQ